jgi:catechol 2,3-dioxygenase-like lactoylglutathione lyase family enzyme
MTIRRAIPNLLSGDLAASRDFYAGFLGFDVAMDEDGFTMFASPSNRTAQITVADKHTPGQDRGVSEAQVSVEVEDVDALHDDAVRRGLEIVYPLTNEPWGIRRFFVRDPDGTVINVAQHLSSGRSGGRQPAG